MTGSALFALVAAHSQVSAAEAASQSDSAIAQPTPGDAMSDTMGEIVVTGTNLRRSTSEGALPISVITADDIALRGGSTGADLFATLPMAGPPSINEATIGSQAARGDVMSVDLRGIGAGSTLMLINGRRIAAHPLSGTDQGVPALSPNANVIPTALLSRVEILRDGASAIYGADAAAGVINSIVSPNAQGGRLSIETAQTQHGGAGEYRITGSNTFKFGRTSIGLSLDLFKRDKMMVSDRDWGTQSDLRRTRDLPAPWNGLPVVDPKTGTAFAVDNDFDNSSTITNFGQFRRGYIQPDFQTFLSGRPTGNAGIVTTASPTGGVATMAADGTFFLVPDGNGGINFKQSTPSRTLGNVENGYYHNRLPHRTLIPGVERINGALFIEHEVNDNLTLFGDVLYSGSRANSQRESANLQNVNEPGIYVPASNPYNPFGERFYNIDGLPNADGTPRIKGAPADVTIAAGTMPNGTKDRYIQVDSSFYRALAGVRGTIGSDWSWESAVMMSGAYSHETETNIYRESLVRKALERTDATAYNPFPVTFKVENGKIVVDKPYTNPASVTDPMYDIDNRYGKTRIITWDAKLSGELFQLPFGGGRVQAAGGTEVRWENYDAWKAPYAGLNPPGSGAQFPYLRENDNDFISMSPNADVSAHQRVLSAYAEIGLPLITPANALPLIHRLELGAAVRHERFSIHGESTTPKFSLLWSPTPWLSLRGSYNRSFRAPNLAQTDTTQLLRVNYTQDPYRYSVTGFALDGSGPRRTYRQGNNRLNPERAENFGLGFVLDVPGVRGLSITGDYWRMKQRDAISALSNADVLALDELALDLATQAALASGKSIDQIDLGSGTGAYAGSARVVRRAVTAADRAAFDAYNAAQTSNASKRAVVGEIENMVVDYINLGSRTLSGLDFGLQYRSPETAFGRFTMRAEATRNLQRDEDLTDEGVTIDQLGRNGYAKWIGNAAIGWSKGGVSVNWLTTYYGSFSSTSAATTEAIYEALGRPDYINVVDDNGVMRYYYRVKPAIQHTLSASYAFGRTVNDGKPRHALTFTVHNLFDADPPVADEDNGFVVGTVNPRGRQFRLRYTFGF
ncbi:TonB-dependent receptor domain-containing protein [Sphingobium lignivorans]|uniref:Outer membrane receptor protein involved in Fe transport n=1 Tax=Sphingobium lignivorans TaxID=2735886 RepID=A0ABR6NET7_9SPHN|nr:TonB-dependent receptor [Sphingobium lignivorans]MBB5985771.1 outer membrane receptor protein involved in Fe transport [Sphingobium lignivorans]